MLIVINLVHTSPLIPFAVVTGRGPPCFLLQNQIRRKNTLDRPEGHLCYPLFLVRVPWYIWCLRTSGPSGTFFFPPVTKTWKRLFCIFGKDPYFTSRFSGGGGAWYIWSMNMDHRTHLYFFFTKVKNKLFCISGQKDTFSPFVLVVP